MSWADICNTSVDFNGIEVLHSRNGLKPQLDSVFGLYLVRSKSLFFKSIFLVHTQIHMSYTHTHTYIYVYIIIFIYINI